MVLYIFSVCMCLYILLSLSLWLSQATAVYQAKEKLKSIDKAKKGKLGTHPPHFLLFLQWERSFLFYFYPEIWSGGVFSREHLIGGTHQVRSPDQCQQRCVRSTQLAPRYHRRPLKNCYSGSNYFRQNYAQVLHIPAVVMPTSPAYPSAYLHLRFASKR